MTNAPGRVSITSVPEARVPRASTRFIAARLTRTACPRGSELLMPDARINSLRNLYWRYSLFKTAAGDCTLLCFSQGTWKSKSHCIITTFCQPGVSINTDQYFVHNYYFSIAVAVASASCKMSVDIALAPTSDRDVPWTQEHAVGI